MKRRRTLRPSGIWTPAWLPERAWLAAMPHTGLGTWTIICLGAGLLALLAGAGVLLRRR